MMESNLSETCRVLFQNKFEKYCISLVFIIRIYHDSVPLNVKIAKILGENFP